MSVRIKLQIKSLSTNKAIESSALVNSAFETTSPCIVLPGKLAEKLNLYPNLPKKVEKSLYEVAGGELFEFMKINNEIECKIILEDRETSIIRCDCIIMVKEKEVIISDKLAGELRISMIDIGQGRWCLKDELSKKERESVEKFEWV